MDKGLFIALLLVAGTAGAVEDPTPELNAERDALLDKIARGEDWEKSVKRYAELVKQRDGVIATSAAAKAKDDAQKATERADAQTRRDWRDAYHKTNDYEVSWRCTLSPDPAHPIPSKEGRFKPDWGKVIRKQTIKFAPKNALDEGEPATMYEVKGIAKNYIFRGDSFDAWRKPFNASVGDLVLVCDGGEDLDHRLPPEWGNRMVKSGFAVRLAEAPHIVKKAKWNPIHVTGSAFFWIIHDVAWKYPEGSYLLSNIEIDKDLGGGRYEIEADRNRGMSWILEVPPTVKGKELLVPGHSVWAVLGDYRFDKSLKKLILVAHDLEARYIVDK
jgi:hypothetical protein